MSALRRNAVVEQTHLLRVHQPWLVYPSTDGRCHVSPGQFKGRDCHGEPSSRLPDIIHRRRQGSQETVCWNEPSQCSSVVIYRIPATTVLTLPAWHTQGRRTPWDRATPGVN